MATMDIKRPYVRLDNPKNPDYCLQDGIIYGWSESNLRYESVWWLTSEGDPIDDSNHVRNILEDRPFDKRWLSAPNVAMAALGTPTAADEPDVIVTYYTLRDANAARQEEWDPANKIDIGWRLNELGGEVGEVCNILKKLHRERIGIKGSRATVDDLADELADVAICIDLAAMTAELDAVRLTVNATAIEGVLPSKLHLTDEGRRLLAFVGHVCAINEELSELPAYEPLSSRLALMLAGVRHVAAREKIDLDSAVRRKFNATSEKIGLKTRLGLTANQR